VVAGRHAGSFGGGAGMRTINAWALIRELPFGYEHSAFVHEGIDVALFETRERALAFKKRLRLTCIKPVRVSVQIGVKP
jgi:hypothetical protein